MIYLEKRNPTPEDEYGINCDCCNTFEGDVVGGRMYYFSCLDSIETVNDEEATYLCITCIEKIEKLFHSVVTTKELQSKTLN